MAVIRQKGLVEDEDVVLWKGKGDCFKPSFSTRETWNATRVAQQQKEWYNGIWFPHATPKYSLLSWLAVQNRLTTGDKMFIWNRGINVACVFCQEPIETRNHLFFTCCYSAEIWTGLTRNLLVRGFSHVWDNIIKALTDQSIERNRLFLVRYTFQLALHSIWRERNNRRHGEAPISPGRMILTMDKQVRNRISSIRELGESKYYGCMELWFGSR